MPSNHSDIFVDRRQSQQAHGQPCRRGGHSAMDSRPWWLKTTYTSPATTSKTTKPDSDSKTDSDPR